MAKNLGREFATMSEDEHRDGTGALLDDAANRRRVKQQKRKRREAR